MKLAQLASGGALAFVALAWALSPTPVLSHDSPQSQAQETRSKQDRAQTQYDGGNPSFDAVRYRDVVCNVGVYNHLTLERQISIGREVARQVDSHVTFINDPVVAEYVNRVGQNLARNSTAPVPFTIKVIDSNAVNALSLPDGSLYLNSGLILAADEEAELAGAMAHAIAHVAVCHAGRQWSSSEVATVPSGPIVFGPGGSDDAMGMFGIARFTRGFEGEADYLGIQYMYSAGYDPSALVSFFAKIGGMEKPPWRPGAVASAFVTHPQNPDRVERSEKEIRSILPTRAQYVVSNSEFEEIKARLVAHRNRH